MQKGFNFLCFLLLVCFLTCREAGVVYGATGAAEATLTFGSPHNSGETTDTKASEEESHTTDSKEGSTSSGTFASSTHKETDDTLTTSEAETFSSETASLGIKKLPATGGNEFGVNQWLGLALLLGLFINNRKKKRGNF